VKSLEKGAIRTDTELEEEKIKFFITFLFGQIACEARASWPDSWPGLACWKFANRNQNSTPRLLIGLSSGRSFPALFLSPIPVLATTSHFI